jgi:chromosome segregation ATPase
MRCSPTLALLSLAALLPALAHADDTPEERLRAALKQSVTEMRSAQDQAAQAQAQLADAQGKLAALQAKFDADEAKIAKGAGTAKPDEVKQLQADLASAQQQNAALQASLSKYQGAVTQAQQVARDKDRESQIATRGLESNTRALQTCKAANAKLIDVAEQVLHLYQDRSFIWVLRKSYEPLVGAAKVDLENIVQDYDDKIRDQEYVPPAAGPPRRGN